MMGAKIAAFELRYQLRNPVFWVTLAAFFLLNFALVTVEPLRLGSPGQTHRNAPMAIADISGTMSAFAMFIVIAFVANVIVRDDETGFGPIIRATGVTKRDYLLGRFGGAFAAGVLAFCGVPLGILVGSFMPWVDPESLGPLQPGAYAVALLAVAVPALFVEAAGFFALATATRSMMATYVGAVAFLVAYTVVGQILGKPDYERIASLFDPFGVAALDTATKYWTLSDRNTLLPPIGGLFLWNRLIWIAAALVLLCVAYAVFRFEARGGKAAAAAPVPAAPAQAAPIGTIEALPRFDGFQRRMVLWRRVKFDATAVFRSPAFLVLLVLGLFNSVGALWIGDEYYGNPLLPVTYHVVQTLFEAFIIIPMIVAIYYGGELVWRDRDRRMHEIIDASPIQDWAFLIPKILAITIVLVALDGVAIAGAIAVQAAKGYFTFELGHYLTWFLLPEAIFSLHFAVLSIFMQALSPNKYVGWGVMALVIVYRVTLFNLGFEHNLYYFGASPLIPLSDMNGQGELWLGRAWLEAYWSAFVLILAVLTYALWQRGTETRLRPRLRRLPRRLSGPAGAILTAGLLAWLGTGGFIFYNTNILNPYQTTQDRERWQAEFEKTLLPFEKLPQPSVTQVTLAVDLTPHRQRALVTGTYTIENRTGAALAAVHLRWNRDLRDVSIEVEGGTLETDYARFAYRIYTFDPPMAPGETRRISFSTRWERPGFRNERFQPGMSAPDGSVVDNGTFLNNTEIAPRIGMDRHGLLQDRVKRHKYGLPPEQRPAKLEDDSARAANMLRADWVQADITVSTDADQVPIVPGYTVSDETKDGRRVVRFKTDAPIENYFSIQSAAYATKSDHLGTIDLAVYSHPPHRWNVDAMLAAMKVSLGLYSEVFSPYQFRQARIAEFPYNRFTAQSLPNTIAYTEDRGFLVTHTDPAKIDTVTYVTAHEIGHQWWGHQLAAADMQGGSMLIETFAQYSALLTMEKIQGKAQIRKFLKYELDDYLRSRGKELVEELPLARVENQPYIHYRKGALVMYFLKEQVGEPAVDRAMRHLLADYAFKPAPYASSKDFLQDLREEVGPNYDELISDLFERITLYDIKVENATARLRPDGKYDVAIEVDAKKFYADGQGKETEAPLAEDFDVGLFDVEPGKADFNEQSVVLATKLPLVSGKQRLALVADHVPKFAGVDPYNERITRNSDTLIGKVAMQQN
jgi:ABC-2 type transport system permease protein